MTSPQPQAVWLIFSTIATVAFFVRGLTGAASTIVFNALFVTALASGVGHGLSLKDGLYWMAVTNVVVSLAMGLWLARTWQLELPLVVYIGLSTPVNLIFSMLLPSVNGLWLRAGLGLALTAAGLNMLRPSATVALGTHRLVQLAIPAALVAGALDGLFGMGGPINIIILSAAGGTPTLFRSRVSQVALVDSTVHFLALASQSVYSAGRLSLFLSTLPVVLIALTCGFWSHRFVKPTPFRLLLGFLVVLAGLASAATVLL